MAPWNWVSDKWEDVTTPKPKPSSQVAFPSAIAPKPAEKSSALTKPFKYLGTAMTDNPVADKLGFGKDDTKGKQLSTPKIDSLSLDTPTGPPTPALFISMAEMSERQQNVPQARKHLQEALSKWPGDVDVLRAAARMEDRQGNLPLAESLYRQAVTANPQHAGAHNDLGLCMARQGKLELSVQEIEQAIHLQPKKALYRNNVATVLVEMQQDQKALAHLAAVHGPAEANYNLGQLLVQRGRTQEALGYFQSALAQNPSMTHAQTAIAKLQGRTAAVPPGATPYVPPQYNGPTGAPAATDYRAELPRHLPPVGTTVR
jgi:tetratricopeptide (TPR) repeat protein